MLPAAHALDPFYEVCKAAHIPETCFGQPRIHAPKTEHWAAVSAR
jgi:hypothetical protein